MPISVRSFVDYKLLYDEHPKWVSHESLKDINFSDLYNALMQAAKADATKVKMMKGTSAPHEEIYKLIKSCRNSGVVHAIAYYPNKGKHLHHYAMWENLRRRYEKL